MTEWYARWYVHVATPVLIALIVNAIIYAMGWQGESRSESGRPMSAEFTLLPPGYVIAVVWTILLGLLGFAHFTARRRGSLLASWSIVALVIWCIGYPFYTRGLRSGVVSSVANVLSLVFAAAVSVVVAATMPIGSTIAAVLPVTVWAAYVNVAQAVACNRHCNT